jgi:hypothetical protein
LVGTARWSESKRRPQISAVPSPLSCTAPVQVSVWPRAPRRLSWSIFLDMVLVDDDQTPKGVPPLSASVTNSSPESQPLLGTSRDHPILDAEAGLADAEVPPPYSAATPLLLAHNQARWRARSRFVQALLLGFVIWLGAALVLGRLTYTLDSEEVRQSILDQRSLICQAARR